MTSASAEHRPDPADSPVARWLPQVSGHQEALDGIRAIAALMVLVFHVAVETGVALAPGVPGALLSRGEMGVPLFFALSGLLLYRPWARAALDGADGPDVRSYLWRRGLRVLPAYWVVAVVALLLWSRNHLGSVRTWFEVLTLTFTYDFDPWWVGTGPYGLGQMWSLCVEASFYLLLPLLALLLTRYAGRGGDVGARARRLLTGLGALTAVGALALVVQFYPDPRPYLHAWLPRTLGMFAAGMALAVVSEWAWREAGPDGPVRRCCRTVAQAPGLCWGIALVVYLIASTPATGPRFVGVDGFWIALIDMVVSVLFALFVIAPVALLPRGAGTRTTAFLRHRLMRFLGKVSYGIFLWQFVVLYLWRDFTGQEIFTGSFWLDLVPVTAGTVLLAYATHRWVEEPTRRWYDAVRPKERKPGRAGIA
ncbi:peptidoglycan/LPS O-acetylase OafA/YrhL [Spinactinospora alkalitolerans]|uniref:Peptidoglycan/LPS O-acetylase OafA/YrhL n=1 Tax=Spinactinospora alkalitolerans TaxID=687207 RepID=A0A852U1W1_9ACTN|nr:acyltransferase [Spinactinospora alkalitolerans]NYE49577.1 peptidoglycan/LPS O-acetylase OafA/YrhL [Spinactinospora alkalitolerans]